MQISPVQNRQQPVFGDYQLYKFGLEKLSKTARRSFLDIFASTDSKLEKLSKGLLVSFYLNGKYLEIQVRPNLPSCYAINGLIEFKNLTKKALVEKTKDYIETCRWLMEQERIYLSKQKR